MSVEIGKVIKEKRGVLETTLPTAQKATKVSQYILDMYNNELISFDK